MNDRTIHPMDENGDSGRGPDSSQYERWFDGLLDERSARRESERVSSDPAQRARFEVDLAIEASLRRSFGAAERTGASRLGPVGLVGAQRDPRRASAWRRVAMAAGVLALIGAALAIALATHDPAPRRGDVAVPSVPPAQVHAVAQLALAPRPRTTNVSLGDVFLDALALDFQPQLDCRMHDRWDAELLAQLETAPCNQEQGVVVLGEWIDPRVDVANMVMLRRGENPIMLVVPRCELDTELCVPKDSGLYVHRGVRDGRTLYEVSPLPGSEVLGCVDAQAVVTQQQL